MANREEATMLRNEEMFCGICRAWTAHTSSHQCAVCGEPQAATMRRLPHPAVYAGCYADESRFDENRLDRLVTQEVWKEKGFLLREGFMDDYGQVFRVGSRFLPA